MLKVLSFIIVFFSSVFSLLAGTTAANEATLHFTPDGGDTTITLREALEDVEARHLTLVFEQGCYEFFADYAVEAYYAITNHDNGLKRVIFPMNRFESVKIQGNGAEFIFHGQVMPFLFDGCEKVEMSGLTIDWSIPFYFQALVMEVNEAEGWFSVQPSEAGSDWAIKHGNLAFPEIDGFSYDKPGETLAFDPLHRRVAHGAWDIHLAPSRVEKRPDGQLQIHAEVKQFPEVGSMLVSKGKMGENRYAPAIYAVRSNNLQLEDVTIHHALGMGFLFERCDTITLSRCGVYVRADSKRMVSTLADATHFCNCKGEILVENSRFQHMLDDGTNVHGTYVEVDEVLNPRQVRVELKHFQQWGFQFAGKGDEVWLISSPDPSRARVKTVESYEQLNERFSLITFSEGIEGLLKPGDVLENKTWNPSFTMRGCTISDHRARSIVLKTPLPILIEDNNFSSMMSAVFLRGESWHWFESGSVEDVRIQNNRFEYCAYSAMEHAVLTISPRLGKQFDSTMPYDRNIRFANNQIRTFGNRIVWASQVDGLEILNNEIIQTEGPRILYPDAPMVELEHCHKIRIEGNLYTGNNPGSISFDPISGSTLTLINNQGFQDP